MLALRVLWGGPVVPCVAQMQEPMLGAESQCLSHMMGNLGGVFLLI